MFDCLGSFVFLWLYYWGDLCLWNILFNLIYVVLREVFVDMIFLLKELMMCKNFVLLWVIVVWFFLIFGFDDLFLFV